MGLPDEHSRAAFDRRIVEHIPAALRFAIRLCGDPHEAEDIVQDALLRATRFRDSFRAESKFSTWLFRIVINAFRDRFARMRIADEIDESVADASSDPTREAGAAEIGELVARHVSSLPPRQREVLVLIAYEQISIADAAAVLEISEQSVRTNLHLARERMREKLAPYLSEKIRER